MPPKKTKFLNSAKVFSARQLSIFAIIFAALGGYLIFRSFAATVNCSSYPTAPAGTASINLCPTSVDHTLPAKFWGYGVSSYFYGDFIQPSYQQQFKDVAPEIFRWSEAFAPRSPGTPTSPNTADKDVRDFLVAMKDSGLNLGAIVQFNSGPKYIPSDTLPAVIDNYDHTGDRSPDNLAAMTNWFMDAGIDVLGYENYNEPGGNDDWYPDPDGYTGQLNIQKRQAWAAIHQRQFSDALHQALSAKGRSTKVLNAVQAGAEGWQLNSILKSFTLGSGTLIDSGGGWPWSTSNMASTSYGPIFDVYDFHPYPTRATDIQSRLNSLAYPTLSGSIADRYKSSLYAFMESARSFFDANGGSSKELAYDEGGFTLGTNVDALSEGIYAVLTARNQAHWKVPFYTLWSANTSPDGASSIWPLFLTDDHKTFRPTIRSSAARDIVGKFLHNYKRQMTGHDVRPINGSGMTPGGDQSNAVQRIQATAGLNADGTKMAVLVVNMDLSNSQPFQINMGTTPSGPITATYMLQNTPVGNMPTTTISAASTITRTLEPGSEYLFEIPLSDTTPPPTSAPTVTLTASPGTINSGDSSTLTWSSTDASSCTASGAWSGSKTTSGSQSLSPTATGTYTLTCTGDGGSGSDSATITVNQPTSLTVAAASTAHTIDGNLNESDWDITTPIAKLISGTTSDTGKWGALWDNNYLYFGVKVTDANLSTDPANNPGSYWQNDSVEVYVDPDASGGTTYDSNDKQLAQDWDDAGLYGVSASTPGVLHAWAPISGGYSVEIAIPWSSLGVTPSSGMNLALDAGINDGISGTRVGQLMWHGDGDNYKDPSGFGLMSLSGTPSANKPGDINQDSKVDILDLSILLSNFDTTDTASDINNDGTVNILDLSILLSNYGS